MVAAPFSGFPPPPYGRHRAYLRFWGGAGAVSSGVSSTSGPTRRRLYPATPPQNRRYAPQLGSGHRLPPIFGFQSVPQCMRVVQIPPGGPVSRRIAATSLSASPFLPSLPARPLPLLSPRSPAHTGLSLPRITRDFVPAGELCEIWVHVRLDDSRFSNMNAQVMFESMMHRYSNRQMLTSSFSKQ